MSDASITPTFRFCTSAIGIAVAIMAGRDAMHRRQAATVSEHWRVASATILESYWSPGSQNRSSVATVRYRYVVAGDTIVGQRIAFQNVTAQRPGAAQAIARSFPVGAKVPVYFNPANSHDSVLLPGNDTSTFLVEIILAAVAGIVGVGILFVSTESDPESAVIRQPTR